MFQGCLGRGFGNQLRYDFHSLGLEKGQHCRWCLAMARPNHLRGGSSLGLESWSGLPTSQMSLTQVHKVRPCWVSPLSGPSLGPASQPFWSHCGPCLDLGLWICPSFCCLEPAPHPCGLAPHQADTSTPTSCWVTKARSWPCPGLSGLDMVNTQPEQAHLRLSLQGLCP